MPLFSEMGDAKETRRNPQTARKVTFELSFFSQGPYDEQDGSPSHYLFNNSKSKRKVDERNLTMSDFSQDLSLKQEGSFSRNLFNNSKSETIRNLAKESKFIQGMVKGSLDPNVFGGYMVQDAGYCFNAVDSYERAAKKMQEFGKPEFSLLYRTQSESFKGYNQDFLRIWRLRNPDSVAMGPAAETYVGYERALSQKDPKYLCIAMLPCTMLWPWLANELINSVKVDNPYYVWFKDNKTSPDHKSHLERFVDYFFAQADLEEQKKCLSIFQEGLVNELNFFRSACDETLCYYSFFQE